MSARKGWENISSGQRNRYLRILSPTRNESEARRLYENGADLSKARGHAGNPGDVATWNRYPDRFREYSLRGRSRLTKRRGNSVDVLTTNGKKTVEGLSPRELTTISELAYLGSQVVTRKLSYSEYRVKIKGLKKTFTGYVDRDRAAPVKDAELSTFTMETDPRKIVAEANQSGSSGIEIYDNNKVVS